MTSINKKTRTKPVAPAKRVFGSIASKSAAGSALISARKQEVIAPAESLASGLLTAGAK